MFLLQLPKFLPLLRTSTTVVERNGKAIVKEVKERLLVYKNAEVKMNLGDALFDVSFCLHHFFSLNLVRYPYVLVLTA
jgi:hypothetical protein